MSTSAQSQQGNLDRYVVIHVATTCDEHGVYVTKDSAEVIELGWILLDAKNCEEVRSAHGTSYVYPECSLLTLVLAAAPRECPRKAHQHPYYTSLQ